MLVVDVSMCVCVRVFPFIQAISLNHFHSVESIIIHDDVDLPFIFISHSLALSSSCQKKTEKKNNNIDPSLAHTQFWY